MTWNELKNTIDLYLQEQGRSEDINIEFIKFERQHSPTYLEITNKGRGIEEGLSIYQGGISTPFQHKFKKQ